MKRVSLLLAIAFSVLVVGPAAADSKVVKNRNNAIDALLTVQDDADTTKAFRFQASGITAGQTRVITVPDSNTTLPIASQVLTFSGPTAARTYTIRDAAASIHTSGTATALTPGAAVSLTVPTSGRHVYTLTTTDNEDTTITFSGAGSSGDEVVIIFATSSTGDEVVTFHATLVSSTGTLTLGTTADRYYTVVFVSDGTKWREQSRTTAAT